MNACFHYCTKMFVSFVPNFIGTFKGKNLMQDQFQNCWKKLNKQCSILNNPSFKIFIDFIVDSICLSFEHHISFSDLRHIHETCVRITLFTCWFYSKLLFSWSLIESFRPKEWYGIEFLKGELVKYEEERFLEIKEDSSSSNIDETNER